MDKLFVIKIGGNVIEDDEKLSSFLNSFALVEGKKILVHGGGKLATQLADQLGIPQQLVNGRRITDAETLKVITMVYAGLVNKQVVAKLQKLNSNAIGLSGADGNTIRAKKRENAIVDFGFVGDVELVDPKLLISLLEAGFVPVIAPLTHDGYGQLLNTNADTIAQEIAKSLVNSYDVNLVYCFEKAGVLKDINNEDSVIRSISISEFENLKRDNIISDGMLPKLENAMSALQAGIAKVVIGKAGELSSLINGKSGTTICHE